MDPADFALRLVQRRRDKHLTQARLANLAGLDAGTISRHERRVLINPEMSTVAKLASALGCSTADLVPVSAAQADARAESGVEQDDDRGELAGVSDLELALKFYPLRPETERDFRRQRWFGGPPSLEDLRERARTLQARDKGRAVADRAPVVEFGLPAGTGSLKGTRR